MIKKFATSCFGLVTIFVMIACTRTAVIPGSQPNIALTSAATSSTSQSGPYLADFGVTVEIRQETSLDSSNVEHHMILGRAVIKNHSSIVTGYLLRITSPNGELIIQDPLKPTPYDGEVITGTIEADWRNVIGTMHLTVNDMNCASVTRQLITDSGSVELKCQIPQSQPSAPFLGDVTPLPTPTVVIIPSTVPPVTATPVQLTQHANSGAAFGASVILKGGNIGGVPYYEVSIGFENSTPVEFLSTYSLNLVNSDGSKTVLSAPGNGLPVDIITSGTAPNPYTYTQTNADLSVAKKLELSVNEQLCASVDVVVVNMTISQSVACVFNQPAVPATPVPGNPNYNGETHLIFKAYYSLGFDDWEIEIIQGDIYATEVWMVFEGYSVTTKVGPEFYQSRDGYTIPQRGTYNRIVPIDKVNAVVVNVGGYLCVPNSPPNFTIVELFLTWEIYCSPSGPPYVFTGGSVQPPLLGNWFCPEEGKLVRCDDVRRSVPPNAIGTYPVNTLTP